MKQSIIDVINTLYQLPQLILGWIIAGKRQPKHKIGEVKIYITEFEGMSLGNYIFVNPEIPEGMWILRHEFGHTIQSRILGWLYIPLIFIPSLLWWIIINKLGPEYDKYYYDFYTEKWANKLIEK